MIYTHPKEARIVMKMAFKTTTDLRRRLKIRAVLEQTTVQDLIGRAVEAFLRHPRSRA